MLRFVMIVGLIVMTVVPLYLSGTFPAPPQTPVAHFERLSLALDAAYPYSSLPGRDLDGLVVAFRDRVSDGMAPSEYVGVVREMLASLHDLHTGVTRPWAGTGRNYFGVARALSDGVVIERIGATGAQAGLAIGDRLLSIDAMPLDEAMATLPPELKSGGTDQHQVAAAARHLLSTTSQELRLEVEKADGARIQCTLRVPPADAPVAKPSSSSASEERRSIEGRRLASGMAYIRVSTLSSRASEDLVAAFDAALDDLIDAPGLILDLRGNGGGDSRIGDRIAGRLLDRWIVYGWEHYRLPLPQRGWVRRMPYVVRPRGTPYAGPVVILIDASCASSTEMLIAALTDSGRARTVGRPTAGGSGNPIPFALPGGGSARISTGSFRRLDGRLIEGIGITPGLPVEFLVDDFRTGRDPDLEAANALLLGDI